MTTATQAREAVATAARAAVPERWTVYPWMPAVEALPCGIVGAQAPYRTHLTAGADQLHLRLVALHQVAVGAAGGDVIEAVVDALRAKLDEAGFGWQSVAAMDEITNRSGVDCFRGGIDLPPITVT